VPKAEFSISLRKDSCQLKDAMEVFPEVFTWLEIQLSKQLNFLRHAPQSKND
jgi:hypothetical protein